MNRLKLAELTSGVGALVLNMGDQTWQHRLEDRGVRFCGTWGNFPTCPVVARSLGRCDGRENRAGRRRVG